MVIKPLLRSAQAGTHILPPLRASLSGSSVTAPSLAGISAKDDKQKAISHYHALRNYRTNRLDSRRRTFLLGMLSALAILLTGCTPFKRAISREQQPRARRMDRAQRRSLARSYGTLLKSNANRLLRTRTARSAEDAQNSAIVLAKKTKAIATDIALYREVGLASRAHRRYQSVLQATKQRIASGALTPEEHTPAGTE